MVEPPDDKSNAPAGIIGKGEMMSSPAPLLATADPNYKLWMQATRPGSQISKTDPRLQFFYHLGFAISRWAFVDRFLFDIFRLVLGSNSEAKAAYLFYKSPNISDHFYLTDSLVNISANAKQAKAWSNIAQVFTDNSTLNFRNRLAHDPVTQIVSAVGGTSSQKQPTIPAPPPEWQIQIEGAKLLRPKQRDTQPIKVGQIIEHIEKVTKLQTALENFLKSLPKKLRKRPPKSVAPKSVPKKGLVKRRPRSPKRP